MATLAHNCGREIVLLCLVIRLWFLWPYRWFTYPPTITQEQFFSDCVFPVFSVRYCVFLHPSLFLGDKYKNIQISFTTRHVINKKYTKKLDFPPHTNGQQRMYFNHGILVVAVERMAAAVETLVAMVAATICLCCCTGAEHRLPLPPSKFLLLPPPFLRALLPPWPPFPTGAISSLLHGLPPMLPLLSVTTVLSPPAFLLPMIPMFPPQPSLSTDLLGGAVLRLHIRSYFGELLITQQAPPGRLLLRLSRQQYHH